MTSLLNARAVKISFTSVQLASLEANESILRIYERLLTKVTVEIKVVNKHNSYYPERRKWEKNQVDYINTIIPRIGTEKG